MFTGIVRAVGKIVSVKPFVVDAGRLPLLCASPAPSRKNDPRGAAPSPVRMTCVFEAAVL